jgi:hypothetical protein
LEHRDTVNRPFRLSYCRIQYNIACQVGLASCLQRRVSFRRHFLPPLHLSRYLDPSSPCSPPCPTWCGSPARHGSLFFKVSLCCNKPFQAAIPPRTVGSRPVRIDDRPPKVGAISIWVWCESSIWMFCLFGVYQKSPLTIVSKRFS